MEQDVAQNSAGQDESEPPKRNGNEGPSRSAADEDDQLRMRLERLSAVLDAQAKAEASSRQNEEKETRNTSGIGQAVTLGMRVLSEFLAAVLVGGLIGWGIDYTTGTTPVFLIIFLLLGAAAGSWSVYRLAMQPLGKER
ncbi:MAG TPA: AtpZ/AtpI family protein [Methylocella sp.]|nr:AtpZ/AtpI family protein [Methylocella sp.]